MSSTIINLLIAVSVLSGLFLIWAITATILFTTKSSTKINSNDENKKIVTVFNTTPAESNFVLKCVSLNILTSGKDNKLSLPNKFAARQQAIKDFVFTSDFDVLCFQEVAKFSATTPNPSEWLEESFSELYTIYGEYRTGPDDIEKNPILIKKTLDIKVTDFNTVQFDTGDVDGKDYHRIFTWIKFTAANGVQCLLITTQMHTKDFGEAQKLDINQLANFVNANDDNKTRQVIICGDFNIKEGVYLAYEDLAEKTGLIFKLGFQSGSTGTRPKQFTNIPSEDPQNDTQYTTTISDKEDLNFILDVGEAFDVFVYSPLPLKVALNQPNRYMRAYSDNSLNFYGLSDHDAVAATFIL